MAGKKISELISGSLSNLTLDSSTALVYSGTTFQHPLSDLRDVLVDSGSHTLNGDQTINGNLVVSGSITAQEYIISSSVTHIDIQTYSGSSNFGDDSNDIHKFIGNVDITGSLLLNGQAIGDESVVTHIVTSPGGIYYIDGIANPKLSFVPGVTYRFNTTAVTGAHPFKFSTSPNGPTEYTTGVTSGVNFLQIEVGYDTTTTLYYYCTAHNNMGNEINILRVEKLLTTASFVTYTGSINTRLVSLETLSGSYTGSFSGSFIGDGSGLYNLPQQDLSNLATTGSNTFVGNQLINGTLIGGPDTFLITTNDLDVATQPHNLTIIPGQVSGDAPQAGYLTLSGGESNSDTIPGGTTFLQGGISNGTGINGGDVYIRGGASFGGGSDGNVYIEGSQITVNGPLLASSLTGSIDYTNLTNAPTLVSGSEQISYTGITDTPTGFTFYNNEIGVNVDVFDFGDNKTIDMQNSSILMLGSTIDSIKQTNTISNNTYSTTITQDGRYTKLHKVDVIEDDMTPGVFNTNEYDIKFDVSSLRYENSIVGSSFSVTNGTTSGDITISAGNGSPVNGQRNGGDVHLWGGSVASDGVGGNVIINSNSGDIFIGPLQNTNAVKIGGGDVNNGVSYAGGIPTFFYGDVTLESGTALNLSGVTINGADNLATTGSNTFVGNQTITGSVDISGSATLNNDNIVSSNTVQKFETITSASYASITPVSGTLYIIID